MKKYGIQPVDDGGVFDYYIDIEHVEEFLNRNNIKSEYKLGGYIENCYNEISMIQTISTIEELPTKVGFCKDNMHMYISGLDCWLHVFEFNDKSDDVVEVIEDENEFHDKWLDFQEF